MVEENENGSAPLHRNKNWERAEGRIQKEWKRTAWFCSDRCSEAVFFVEATRDGKLPEDCQRTFNEAGLNVKVVEKSGSVIKMLIVKSNSFAGCSLACE